MKNIKIERNFVGRAWWKGTKTVNISGIPEADSFSSDLPEEEKEKIIQSWKTIAVLETKSSKPFQVGFIRGDEVWILKYPIKTMNGKFGMRIGKDNLKFFAIDSTFQDPIQLSPIEIVEEGDPRYSDLPLY